MSENGRMSTKTMAYCAILAALGVVLARLVGLMPTEASRYSIEAVPTVIAGILFGPLAGGLVGFTADFVGCLFSAYGYNPIFCIPPILYGVCGGLVRPLLARKMTFWRVLLAVAPAAVIGSILWQSFALAYVYSEGAFWPFLTVKLVERSVQFVLVAIVDSVIIYLLFRSNVFRQIGVWPAQFEKRGK